MKKIFGIILIYLLASSTISAQTFGFGCLGLSGFYGGYGIHTYDATGINSRLDYKYSFTNLDPPKFERSTGFRVGANLLRADFESIFITAKGFFQFGKEEHSVTSDGQNNTQIDENYELQSNHWGIALDFGLPIFSFLQLKLIEGGITFYDIEYKENTYENETLIIENTYKNDSADISYYLGTGIIIVLVKDYVSIEGTAMYHFYKIETLEHTGDNRVMRTFEDYPVIENGKFAAAVQLNIGFPL